MSLALFLLAGVLAVEPGTKTAPEPSTWTDGPAIVAAADLVKWFEGEGKGAVVRIPVTVQATPLGIEKAWIGTTDPLHVRVDDTALGVSLLDRVHQYCPDPAAVCTLWMDGHWGGIGGGLIGQRPGDSKGEYVFSVHHVEGRVAEGEAARVRIRQ